MKDEFYGDIEALILKGINDGMDEEDRIRPQEFIDNMTPEIQTVREKWVREAALLLGKDIGRLAWAEKKLNGK